MKVLVLGAGVVGTASAYYLRQAGHEVDRPGPSACRRHGDQLRQCGPGIAGVLGSMGRAWRAAKGATLDDDDASSTRDPALAGSLDVALDVPHAWERSRSFRLEIAMLVRLHRYLQSRYPRFREPAAHARPAVAPKAPGGAARSTTCRMAKLEWMWATWGRRDSCVLWMCSKSPMSRARTVTR